MIVLAKRNLKIFFKDKTAVFFSLLAVFIVVGLYVLFLRDTWTMSFSALEGASVLMDNWAMAGLVAITPFTAALGAFGIMINDKERKIYKDFYSSPIKRYEITGGYILSSFLVSLVLSGFALIFTQIYIVANGGALQDFLSIAKILGVIILSVFMNTSLVFFIVTFLDSQNGFATVSTIMGTLIGFLTGVYIPIGMMPKMVQTVIKVFPASQSALLLRNIMMEKAMEVSFANLPLSAIEEIKETMGLNFKFASYEVSLFEHLLYIIIIGLVFFLLALWRVSKKSK